MNVKKQKGVSLIITFFIMIIILAVVLSISTLLYSEVIVIRNIGNSIVAFYAADSGAEKALYYDEEVVPTGAARGICNICAACPTCFDNCSATPNSANGCTNCTDCHIVFKTTVTAQKYYNAIVDIRSIPPPLQGECAQSAGFLQSYGTYANAKRAVNLDISQAIKTGLGPSLSNNGTTFKAKNQEEIIHISVLAPKNLPNLNAYIYYSSTDPANGGIYVLDSNTPNPVSLSYNNGQNAWQGDWNAHETGYYFITIGAYDPINGICASIQINP